LGFCWANNRRIPPARVCDDRGNFMNQNTNEYEISDACPESLDLGTQKDFDEKYEKWKAKQIKQPPAWRWVTEEEAND
jgi:hypothetical protein